MIINLLIAVIINLLSAIFVISPVVTISDVWIIGSDLSNYLTMAVQYWNSFMITFPYAQTGWNVFLYTIIPFEIMMLTMRFFLGHRNPESHD